MTKKISDAEFALLDLEVRNDLDRLRKETRTNPYKLALAAKLLMEEANRCAPDRTPKPSTDERRNMTLDLFRGADD